MKRLLFVAFAFGAACADPPKKPAAPPGVTCPSGYHVAALAECGDPGIAEPSSAPAKDAGSAPEAALPPPKPTTIALAHTGDAKLDDLLRTGDEEFEAGKLAEAEAVYEVARKTAPKRAGGLVGVTRVAIARASPGLAYATAEKNPVVVRGARDLKRAVEMEPTYGPAHVERGRALLLLGDAPAAEAALRRGLELMPEEVEAHSALGVALLANGKVEEARVELEKARDLDPGSAARRGNLGTVLFMRGKVPEAIREYEAEARLAPDDARAHSDLGTALLAASEFARALGELRRAIDLDPTRATFRSNLGYGLQLEGKVRDAIVEYREAIRLDDKLASAWINLATALARDPKTRGEARQALKKAQALDASDPRVKANLEELDALERGAKDAG